jgi:hypothetical protein
MVRIVVVLAVLLAALYGCGSPLGGQEAKTVEPPPVDESNVAEIYVLGASGGEYWISWHDDTGDVAEVHRKHGTVVEDPKPYRVDISEAPTDGSDTLFVDAGKRTMWEGDLSLVLKVGGKFRDCYSISETDPAIAETYVRWTVGDTETSPVCRTHFWYY